MSAFTKQSTSGMSFNSACGYNIHLRRFEREARADLTSEVVVLKIRERDWKLMDEVKFINVDAAMDYFERQPLIRGWQFRYEFHDSSSPHLYGWNCTDRSQKWDDTGKRLPI